MTGRERVLTALAHKATDRVPRLLYEEAIGYTPPIEQLLRERCGGASPRRYFNMDLTSVQFNPTTQPRSRFGRWRAAHGGEKEGASRLQELDEWGVWWRKGDFHHFAHLEPVLADVREVRELEEYPWPDLEEGYRWAGLRDRVEALHGEGYAVTGYAGSVFERSWYLRGMENLMVDMVTRPELAHWLFERTSVLQRFAAAEFARAGVDIVITGDDVAGQRGMLMKVQMWREFLKPRLAATVRAVKAARPETFVFYHSDGNVEAIIPDLIEIGIDILNPVQPECMDPARIKREYGERLSFWGTVSVQRTMPFGTVAEVRAEVRARVELVAKGGGLILAPAHVLGPETPWENIVAFFDEADRTPLPDQAHGSRADSRGRSPLVNS